MTERKDAGTLCVGCEKCIGMNTHKQISLDPSCLLDSDMQGDKKVCVTREVGPHGTALDLRHVDPITQFERNLKHHIFLFGAIGSNGAWIFAAMPRVDGHHNQAVGGGG